MDRSFLEASLPDLIRELSLDEKVTLLAGKDWWRTQGIPRLGIPSVKVTDGPNGARGESFFRMTPATVTPNATCLAAAFSPSLAYTTGQLLAADTKARNASCLLGPTVGIARNPLGGRTFESFSEDPTLSGILASEYIRGLQDSGVAATIKHFIANDQEHERMGADCTVSSRALREVYLRPFQLAMKRSKPWSIMTSYNKVNGTHCSESDWLLNEILKKEWGFDGLVMSDWFGTYSVAEAINAGLDLEMPGLPRWRRKELVRQLVNAHKISRKTIDLRIFKLLTWVQKLARLDPDMVFGRINSPERTRTEDREADAKIVRRLCNEGIVLLKNRAQTLPITQGRVAVIGPNAKADVITGGGSARLRAAWSVTPWQGMVENRPSAVSLDYSLGCKGAKFLPIFGDEMSCSDGKTPGFDISHYAIVNGKQGSRPVVSEQWHNSDLMLADFYHPELGKHYFTEVTAIFTPPITGKWEFEASVTGQAWLFIDDEMVLDLSKEQKRTSSFFGNGTEGTTVQIEVTQGEARRFRFLHDSRPPPLAAGVDSTPLEIVGLKLGSFPVVDAEEAITCAVAMAKSSDVAVIVVGLNQDWESESYDRPTLSLPLRSDELINRVADGAPDTKIVVVAQTGSAISMPWLDKVDSVVYSWYGGNEAGNGIADIIYGTVNPSGRLPLTLPRSEDDIAAHLNRRSVRTKIHYDEGIWVGYKHHNARHIEPLFPFGHGLSYTQFDYSGLKLQHQGSTAEEWTLRAEITVINSGSVAGAHSVHFYTSPPPPTSTSLEHPAHSLQAFTKTTVLKPGESETVVVEMDKYAISHWDELISCWMVEQGEWHVRVGRDAQTMVASASFQIGLDMEWSGL